MDFAQILMAVAMWCSLNAGGERLMNDHGLAGLRKEKMNCQTSTLSCLENNGFKEKTVKLQCFKDAK